MEGGVKPYALDSLEKADLNRFNVDLLKEVGDRKSVTDKLQKSESEGGCNY